jgi:glycosyltransferase involved in cell wall biosynthesis
MPGENDSSKGNEMTRKLGLNLQPLAAQHMTGIGVYTKEVTKRLPSMLQDDISYDMHVFDFLGRNHAEELVRKNITTITDPNAAMLSDIKTCRLLPLGAYIRLGRLGGVLSYHKLLKTSSDVTVFFNYLRPWNVAGKSIITVYDMVSMRFPETMEAGNRRLLHRHLMQSCQRADLIMTISDYSKSEIVSCMNIPEEKVRVAKCGFDRKLFYPAKDAKERLAASAYLGQKYRIRSRYILYLGTLEPRKNVDVLIDAFLSIRDRFPDVKLVISGGNGWQYEKTAERLASPLLADSVIRTGFVPEDDKRLLYLCSEMLVFPSLYEGFGLPVLEAMACGTPVVSSNSSSLPEVLGDAGVLCEPDDRLAFSDAMSHILSDRMFAAFLSGKGKSRAMQFSWENAAQAYAAAIEELLESDLSGDSLVLQSPVVSPDESQKDGSTRNEEDGA